MTDAAPVRRRPHAAATKGWLGRRLLLVTVLGALTALSATAGGAALSTSPAASVATHPDRTDISSWDWPSFGRGYDHTFSARTTLTPQTVATLKPAWTFPTGDSVTATPTVVDNTVYVGSWDTNFYALDLRTGALRWKFALTRQPAVTPFPGQNPRDSTSDGGLITSSAWFEPGRGVRPDLVIFGGGYTLYALNAHTGHLFWQHDYTGRPDLPPDPLHDSTRIFSSPVVVDGKVLFGVSADGLDGHHGYAVAADLATGAQKWAFQTDVDVHGRILNDGCGGVWSSGTVLRSIGLVIFDVADCKATNSIPFSESVIALHIGNGHLGWTFRAPRNDPGCDKDFGATVNAGVDRDGEVTFLGVGGKDGTYYSLNPRNGHIRWQTNVVFGGSAGGFIGTPAFDGHHVIGSTALGDFGNGPVCQPSNPRDVAFQEPTVHAFSSNGGAVAWEQSGGASFSATTVAGGMSFNGLALKSEIQVRSAANGALLATLHLANANWGGIAVVGNSLVFGVGSTYQGSPAGIAVFTPSGVPPVVPAR